MKLIYSRYELAFRRLIMLLKAKKLVILGTSSGVHQILFNLKGWGRCNTPLVLKESKPDTSVNLPNELIEKTVNRADDIQSIQTFKRSEALLIGISFMPKYYSRW